MFFQPSDIANRALQHLGLPKISTLGDTNRGAIEMNLCYDKLRQWELEAHMWRFSARKTAIRPITSTTQVITFPAYSAGTTYQQTDVVNDTTANVGNNGTALYISLVSSNTGNTPSSSPTKWQPYFGPDNLDTYSSSAVYYTGEMAYDSAGSGSKFYMNTVDATTNQVPHSTNPPWSAAALTGATGVTLFIPYPITRFTNAVTRSAYRLPSGFLRIAPQDPKIAGGYSEMVSAGMQASDFQLEGGYLLSSANPLVTNGPLIFRFVADISDVTQMQPQFCELLALHMAYDCCETLTGKQNLKQALDGAYAQKMMLAHKTNLIQQGSTEPEENDLLLSRIPFNPDQGTQPQQRGR